MEEDDAVNQFKRRRPSGNETAAGVGVGGEGTGPRRDEPGTYPAAPGSADDPEATQPMPAIDPEGASAASDIGAAGDFDTTDDTNAGNTTKAGNAGTIASDIPDAPTAPAAAPEQVSSNGAGEGDNDGGPSLLRSSAVMAIATMVSRITGFLRTLALLWALGSTLFADTFQLANTLPNNLYILIGGGALNAVFVPQLVRAMKRDSDGGEAFGQRLLTLVTVVLGVLTILVTLAAPLIIRLFASDQLLEPHARAHFDLAVTFALFCFPQVFFYGIYVVFGQILNARSRFGPMMWAPVLNNVIAIAVFATFIMIDGGTSPETITDGQITLLGLGSTLGIVAQAVCLLPVLRSAGFRLRTRFDWRGAGLAKSGRLAFWTIGFVLVNQLWFVTASRLGTGAGAEALEKFGSDDGYGFTPYSTAFLIAMLPHAVIAVSVVTALLPQLSRSAAENAIERVRSDLAHGLRLIAVVIIPASTAFFALAPLLTVGLLQHSDSMTHRSAQFIGYVLMGFAPGLIGFSSHYVVLRGFYAYEDTRTPFLLQMVVVGTSIVTAVGLYAVLPVQWKTVGISTAYGVGYWVGFLVSLAVLRRRVGGLSGHRLIRTYLAAGVAAIVSGTAGYAVGELITGALGSGPGPAALALVIGGLVLVGGYLLLARVLRIRDVTEVVGIVRGKLGR